MAISETLLKKMLENSSTFTELTLEGATDEDMILLFKKLPRNSYVNTIHLKSPKINPSKSYPIILSIIELHPNITSFTYPFTVSMAAITYAGPIHEALEVNKDKLYKKMIEGVACSKSGEKATPVLPRDQIVLERTITDETLLKRISESSATRMIIRGVDDEGMTLLAETLPKDSRISEIQLESHHLTSKSYLTILNLVTSHPNIISFDFELMLPPHEIYIELTDEALAENSINKSKKKDLSSPPSSMSEGAAPKTKTTSEIFAEIFSEKREAQKLREARKLYELNQSSSSSSAGVATTDIPSRGTVAESTEKGCQEPEHKKRMGF